VNYPDYGIDYGSIATRLQRATLPTFAIGETTTDAEPFIL